MTQLEEVSIISTRTLNTSYKNKSAFLSLVKFIKKFKNMFKEFVGLGLKHDDDLFIILVHNQNKEFWSQRQKSKQ